MQGVSKTSSENSKEGSILPFHGNRPLPTSVQPVSNSLNPDPLLVTLELKLVIFCPHILQMWHIFAASAEQVGMTEMLSCVHVTN
jgi:hypothetical protein